MKKLTRILVSALLVLCMLMPMSTMVFAVSSNTPTPSTTGVSYYSGKTDFTAEINAVKSEYTNNGKVITIDSADKLIAFAKESGTTTFAGATVNITTDIVINEGYAYEWIRYAPAFNWPGITNFSGTFNGNGHTISGIYLRFNQGTAGDTYHGFFNILNQGTTTIKDLGIVNSLFYGEDTSYAPSFIGRINDGKTINVNNVYSNAIIYQTHNKGTNGTGHGGFVALITNTKTATFTNCVFDGIVKVAKGNAAGIVGYMGVYGGQAEFYATLKNCVTRGLITTAYGTSGAMVGTVPNIKIENCVNLCTGTGNLIANVHDSTTNSSTTVTGSYVGTNGKVFGDDADATKYETAAAGTSASYTMPTLHTNLTDNINYVPTDLKVFSNSDNTHYYMLKYIKDIAGGVKTFNINSEDAFVGISGALNMGVASNEGLGLTIKLTRDMMFNAGGKASTWATTAPEFKWTPINVFRGTLDGQGHSISGIYLNVGSNNGFNGVISVLKPGATVKDIGFVNSYFTGTGSSYTPSIIGRINNDKSWNLDKANITLSGIYSEIIASGNNSVGGIVCLVTNVDETAKIENCVFAGKLTSIGTAGGIVGKGGTYLNDDGGIHPINLYNCANIGTVNGAKAGAMAGDVSKINLTNCVNFGTVTSSANNFVDNALVALMDDGGTHPVLEASATNTYVLTDLNQKVFSESADNTTFNTVVAKETTSNAVKGTALFESGWTARDKMANAENTELMGDYPLPTVIYDNFFKIDLKYVQTTAVNAEGKFDARFTAEIDAVAYEKYLFDVVINLKNGTTLVNDPVETTKVFTTITGTGEGGYTTVTARDGRYFVSVRISGIDAETVESITVTPSTVAGQAGTVEGETKVLTFNGNVYTGLAENQ